MLTAFASMIGLLAFATLVCLWRGWTLFRTWTPTAAHVEEHDYVTRQERYGFGRGYAGFGPYNRGVSRVRERIAYEDAAGERRQVSIRRWVSHDYAPDQDYVIWLDPTRPGRLTPYGPFFWLAAAGVIAGPLVIVLASFRKLG